MIRQRQPLVVLGMLTAMSSAASYGLLVTMVRHVVTTQAHPIVMIAFSSLFGAIMTTVIFHRHILQDSRAPRKAVLLAGVSGLFSLGATGQPVYRPAVHRGRRCGAAHGDLPAGHGGHGPLHPEAHRAPHVANPARRGARGVGRGAHKHRRRHQIAPPGAGAAYGASRSTPSTRSTPVLS